MDTSRLKAVIFDMDGLMLDTESIARVAWRKAGNDLGYAIDDSLFLRLIGRTLTDCETILKEAWSPQFSIRDMSPGIAKYWQEEVAARGIPRKEGLIELIDFIDSLGISKAVATSSRRENTLQKLGELAARFTVIVTGDEITRGKPAPDIFLLAAQKLGLKPEECLVLEDSLPGIAAAEAAGMYVIMVPDMVPATENIRHACTSLSEVHAWLKEQMPRSD